MYDYGHCWLLFVYGFHKVLLCYWDQFAKFGTENKLNFRYRIFTNSSFLFLISQVYEIFISISRLLIFLCMQNITCEQVKQCIFYHQQTFWFDNKNQDCAKAIHSQCILIQNLHILYSMSHFFYALLSVLSEKFIFQVFQLIFYLLHECCIFFFLFLII